MSNEYLSIDDIASELNLHRKTVERYVRDKLIKGTKVGNKYRIPRSALDRFLQHAETEDVRQCHIIVVPNHKGGVGKTTTCVNLGASLGQLNYRVLLVDLDPQASMTLHLGFDPNKMDRNIYTALQAAAKRIAYDTNRLLLDAGYGVSLLPANLELAQFDLTMNHVLSRENLVKSVLAPLQDSFDFIIIDCGPSLSLLTINALTAADMILIPVEAEFLAVRGVSLLLDTIENVQETTNPDLKVLGILITKYDARGNIAHDMQDNVRQIYGRHMRVFEAVIPRGVKVVESSAKGSSIVMYAPDSAPAVAYRQLTDEILRETGMSSDQLEGQEQSGALQFAQRTRPLRARRATAVS